MLIDTHCHIYLPDFDEDRQDMILRAEKERVERFLLPAIDSGTHKQMLSVENQYSKKCRSMMGLHPCSVKENYVDEIRIVENYLAESGFVAIGEIGLDFYWDTSFTAFQYKAFRHQIDLALSNDLPIVIHSRNSIDECVQVVAEKQKGNLKGVFHCFSGSREQAASITDLGFYLGIGGVLTFKNSGLAEVAREVDMGKILLETDSPYLAPVPFRGKRNESSYLKYVVRKLSEVKEISEEDVEEITTTNAKELFRI